MAQRRQTEQKINLMSQDLNFAYFGGEPLGVPILKRLLDAGLRPNLVVCSPDRPFGRKKILTPPPLKIFAQEHGLSVFQPTNYKDDVAKKFLEQHKWDMFVVVAYNFILPTWLIELPRHQTVNIHPSLLPRLRGASPIRSAILRDEPDAVGVSVMLLDEKMDHGPILAQQPFSIEPKKWPVSGPDLDNMLAEMGGDLLTKTLPQWLSGEIIPQTQDHEKATYCGRFIKADSELAINPLHLPNGDIAKQAWCKINAFAGIGDTFFVHKDKRVKITKAQLRDNQLHILRVIPEGKKEMDFDVYLQSVG
jgi:methionyl-tRNA formyltransferase